MNNLLKESADFVEYFDEFDNDKFFALYKNGKASLIYDNQLILKDVDFCYILTNGSVMYRKGDKRYMKVEINIHINQN